jgi:hypothetical protein
VGNSGAEDGLVNDWSPEKRRAYGGLYRYHLISSIQRSGNWSAGPLLLAKALLADPSLAVDLDLFYNLALGTQPIGYQGSAEQLELSHNAGCIQDLLADVFGSPNGLRESRRLAYGTANYALGLVAYNTHTAKLGRKYLWKAAFYRPELLHDSRLMGGLLKSFIHPDLIKRLRDFKASSPKIFKKKSSPEQA